MKHLYFLLSMLFFSTLEIFAQLPSMPSPMAANLGLYGEIPVSAYTGTPNISIPLYEIQGKNIKVPISLSYHASGIRPEVHPGPTGLGWTLFAGGAITRTVRGGAPDEYDARNSTNGRIYGYLSLGNNSWMAKSDWKTSQISTLESGLNCQFNSRAAYDFEADEFSFNFLGISGKFYFDQNGGIQIQSDRPLKVSFDPNNYLRMYELDFEYTTPNSMETFFHQAIRGFIITDEYGNRYYFGRKEAIEISDPISYGKDRSGYGSLPDGTQMCATSWFITRIESADGMDFITFEYERGPFISQLYRFQDAYSYSGIHGFGWGTYTGYRQDGSFVSPVYLTKINSSNGASIRLSYSESQELDYPDGEYEKIFQIAFEDQYPWLNRTIQVPRLNNVSGFSRGLNNIRWLKLDEIFIFGPKGTLLRDVRFYYNDIPTERLFLESLYISGQTDKELYSYRFGYKNRNNLRPYLQSITDHWGFDNGRGYSSSFSPSQRDPDALRSQNGILSSIYYPTGGVTTFEYEGHSYSSVVDNKDRTVVLSASGNAGGVRVRKITSQDEKGGGFVKEYIYSTSPSAVTVSSGVLNATPVYSYNLEVTDCGGEKLKVSRAYSNPVIPLTQWNDGRYITYTDVCELRTDNGSNNGYIRYTFTNHNNGYTDVLLAGGQYHREFYPKNPHNSRAFERGKPQSEYRYNASGLLVYKKKVTWNRYGLQGEDNPRSMLFEPIHDGLSGSFGYVSYACYLNYTYKFLPESEVETVYDLNGTNPVAKTTQYKYNPLGLEQERSEYLSDGSQKGINTYYISDVVSTAIGETTTSGGCSDEANAWLKMYKLGMPVERIEWTQRNGVKTYNDASYTEYSLFDNFPRFSAQHRFLPTTSAASYQKANLVTCGQNRYDISKDARLEQEERIEKYDAYGNLMLHRDRSGVPTNFLWGYNGQYPIAKAVNAGNALEFVPRYGEVMHTERVSLPYNGLNAIQTTYTFNTSEGTPIQVALPGAGGYHWYVMGYIDESIPFHLVNTRGGTALEQPWADYYRKYPTSTQLDNIPAGRHTLRISDAEASGNPYSPIAGEFRFNYWSPDSIGVTAVGADDLFYENFEADNQSSSVLGYHSDKSHVGSYSVSLHTNPARAYALDYRVYKSGKWNYVRREFLNGSATINEGTSAIDDVRVFPVDASVTTYSYYPIIGVRSATNERGITELYEYDSFGRLKAVRDNNRNIIKSFEYNYYNR